LLLSDQFAIITIRFLKSKNEK